MINSRYIYHLLVILLLAPCIEGLVNCREEFSALEFDIAAFERYPFYFRDDSRIILPQAGKYVGAQAIAEYIAFAQEAGPYVKDVDIKFQKLDVKELNETDTTCTFIYKVIRRVETEPSLTKESTILLGVMLQFRFDYAAGYIREVDAFFTDNFLELIFGNVLNTDKTRDFICNVSESCPNTNVGVSHSDCVQKLKDLPTFSTSTKNFDGNDFGCRALHAAFALENQDHCAHISFEPQEDPKGNIKCQTSKYWTGEDFFDQKDIDDFQDFVEDERFVVESSDGYRLLSMETEKPSVLAYVLVGFVAPTFLMICTFYVVKRKEVASKKEEKRSSSLSKEWLGNGAKKLISMILVILSALFIVNGFVFSILQIAARNWNWDEFGGLPENAFVDRYRGDALVVTETVPHTLMSDDQFTVYTVLFVWSTCIITGFGLEIFVWRQFVQEWTDAHERAWRFAQFLVPFLALTSFGLALHSNFLFLPFCVLGSWKCGFPEIFMSLYLGLYSKKESREMRLSALFDGIGSTIHHSSASLVISLIAVNPVRTLPLVRYGANPIFILIMQHWTVMIQYVNMPLYAAIQLGLEWYFEWSVFSDLAQMYYLHWIFALVAGTMLVAHWFYVLAAIIPLVGNHNHDTRKSVEENVFVRGIELMTQNLESFSEETLNEGCEENTSRTVECFDDSIKSSSTMRRRENKISTSHHIFLDGSIQEA